MKRTFFSIAAGLVGLAASASAQVAYSDFINPAFGGMTSSQGWFNLNSTTYPGYGTFGTSTDPWPSPISSNEGSGVAELDKVSGSGYMAGASTNAIYSNAGAGTFSITETTPVADLETVFVQVYSTADFGPVGFELKYNNGSQALAPTDAGKVFDGIVMLAGPGGPTPVPTSIWAYQWDVTGLGINSFEAIWSTTGGSDFTFGASLDQSDVYTQAVPEPSTWVLLLLGGSALVFFARRMRRTSSAA